MARHGAATVTIAAALRLSEVTGINKQYTMIHDYSESESRARLNPGRSESDSTVQVHHDPSPSLQITGIHHGIDSIMMSDSARPGTRIRESLNLMIMTPPSHRLGGPAGEIAPRSACSGGPKRRAGGLVTLTISFASDILLI